MSKSLFRFKSTSVSCSIEWDDDHTYGLQQVGTLRRELAAVEQQEQTTRALLRVADPDGFFVAGSVAGRAATAKAAAAAKLEAQHQEALEKQRRALLVWPPAPPPPPPRLQYVSVGRNITHICRLCASLPVADTKQSANLQRHLCLKHVNMLGRNGAASSVDASEQPCEGWFGLRAHQRGRQTSGWVDEHLQNFTNWELCRQRKRWRLSLQLELLQRWRKLRWTIAPSPQHVLHYPAWSCVAKRPSLRPPSPRRRRRLRLVVRVTPSRHPPFRQP